MTDAFRGTSVLREPVSLALAAKDHPPALTFGHLVLEHHDDLAVSWHMLGTVERKAPDTWSWAVEYQDANGDSQQITVRPVTAERVTAGLAAPRLMLIRRTFPPEDPEVIALDAADVRWRDVALTMRVPSSSLPAPPAAGGTWRGWGTRGGSAYESFCAIGPGVLTTSNR